jgi:Ca2+-transporting ATPase
MGCRGTDVAREAASLVLLDDNFASIVQAVRLGRRIFDNLRKAMSFIVSVHIPIAGMSLLPVFLNWPLVLLPVHVVFLELIIDPACSVVFEAEKEEPDVMCRPPRRVNAALFDRSTMLRSLTQGIFVLVATLGIFATYLPSQGDLVARAASFLTLVVGNLGLIFSSRTTSGSFLRAMKRPNPTLWWVCGGTSLLLVFSLTLPFLQSLFRFDLLPWSTAAIAVGAGLLAFLLMEVSKVFFFRTGVQEKAV